MVSDYLLLRRILWYGTSIAKQLNFRSQFDLSYEPWLKQFLIRMMNSISVTSGTLSHEYTEKHAEVDWVSLGQLSEISLETPEQDIWEAATVTVPGLMAQLEQIR